MLSALPQFSVREAGVHQMIPQIKPSLQSWVRGQDTSQCGRQGGAWASVCTGTGAFPSMQRVGHLSTTGSPAEYFH